MKITALDHVQLAMPASGESQARHFYKALLELPEVEKPEPLASRGGCWFGNDNLQIHLGVEENFSPAKKAHPALRVREIEVLAEKLSDAGFDVKWDDSVPHVKRFYCSDPFGNRIEFLRDGDRFLE